MGVVGFFEPLFHGFYLGVEHLAGVLGIVTGAVVGLVAITPAARFVNMPASLVIGAVAGFRYRAGPGAA